MTSSRPAKRLQQLLGMPTVNRRISGGTMRHIAFTGLAAGMSRASSPIRGRFLATDFDGGAARVLSSCGTVKDDLVMRSTCMEARARAEIEESEDAVAAQTAQIVAESRGAHMFESSDIAVLPSQPEGKVGVYLLKNFRHTGKQRMSIGCTTMIHNLCISHPCLPTNFG
ncbi:hypothetical protein EK21DRAFT_92551 [Setomelanomma holmii]|uniref:Uncharacterized protein n=1 Tax=Setomelanomma holmii TaxID=210430 RepID=A0A9P4LJ44_9PLEO|nr:hypothetical protein EK21DRAFT_92551 [Setomelanomma holmii]